MKNVFDIIKVLRTETSDYIPIIAVIKKDRVLSIFKNINIVP